MKWTELLKQWSEAIKPLWICNYAGIEPDSREWKSRETGQKTESNTITHLVTVGTTPIRLVEYFDSKAEMDAAVKAMSFKPGDKVAFFYRYSKATKNQGALPVGRLEAIEGYAPVSPRSATG